MEFIRGQKPKIILGIGLDSVLAEVGSIVLRGYDHSLVIKIKKLNYATKLNEETINYNWQNHLDKSYYDRLYHLFKFTEDKKAEWSIKHEVNASMAYSFYDHDAVRLSREKEKRILDTIEEMKIELGFKQTKT